MAEVHVRVISSAAGKSEVSVSISPGGDFEAGRLTGPARTLAYERLAAVVQREVAAALSKLGGA